MSYIHVFNNIHDFIKFPFFFFAKGKENDYPFQKPKEIKEGNSLQHQSHTRRTKQKCSSISHWLRDKIYLLNLIQFVDLGKHDFSNLPFPSPLGAVTSFQRQKRSIV